MLPRPIKAASLDMQLFGLLAWASIYVASHKKEGMTVGNAVFSTIVFMRIVQGISGCFQIRKGKCTACLNISAMSVFIIVAVFFHFLVLGFSVVATPKQYFQYHDTIIGSIIFEFLVYDFLLMPSCIIGGAKVNPKIAQFFDIRV